MDRDFAWKTLIDGYTGTAYASRFATRVVDGPIVGYRFSGGEERPTEPFYDFFARGSSLAPALEAIAESRPLPEHYVTVLDDGLDLSAPASLGGYRLSYSEALMVRDLCDPLPPQGQSRDIRMIHSAADGRWANDLDPAGEHWISDDNLDDPRMSHYAVVADGSPVARGRILRLDANRGFVSRLYTSGRHRRLGLARALMTRLLTDEVARGARWSVLQSSSMAEPLYVGLGYRVVGITRIFVPAAADRP